MLREIGGPGESSVGLMKKLGIGAIALAMLLSLSASAGERAWYVAVEGGMNWSDVSAEGAALPLCGILGLTPCGPDTSTDAGWAAFATIGIHAAENLRLEGEVGRRSAGFGDKGDITNTTVMLNGLLDIPMSSSISMSVGAGLGFDWVSTDQQAAAPFPTSDNSSGFAYQAIAELSYSLSDRVDLTVSYRYLGTSSFDELYADVRMYGAGGDTAIARVNDVSSSSISVGLRFDL